MLGSTNNVHSPQTHIDHRGYTPSRYADRSEAELRSLAAERRMIGGSDMTKSELISALRFYG